MLSKFFLIFKNKPLNNKIISLSYPVILGMISHTLIQVSDTLMVGKLGPESVAVAGMGGMAYFTVLSFIIFGASGIQIIIARRFGEKEFIQVAKALSTVIYFSFFAGILFTVLGYLYSGFYIQLLSDDPAIIQRTTSYLQYRCLGTLFFFMSFAFRGFYDGLGYTLVGMTSAIITMVSNIFLNWLLIYGNLGFPNMGTDGAAVASSIAGGVGLIIFIGAIFKKEFMKSLVLSKFKFDFPILKELVIIGAAPAIDGSLTNVSFLLFNKMAGMIGTATLAASTIVFTIISISFMPGFGFSIAATTILGQAVGAKKIALAKIGTYRSAHYSAFVMGVMGAIFIIFGKFIISQFSDDMIVLEETYPALVLVSLVQIGDAYHMTMGSALRSAGLVYWVMTCYILTSYLIMLPIAYLFGVYYDFRTTGLWSSIFVWILILSILFVWKFKKGDWKDSKV